MTVNNSQEASNGTTQISSLPSIRQYVTTHDAATGKAIIHSERDASWMSVRDGQVAMSVAFTTSTFPPSLNGDADVREHEKTMASGTLGLVQKGGTVCRVVDFRPANRPAMHRTRSLDYGIVLEGSVEMILDSGEVRALRRGDIVVQRGTMHAWRNPSSTEWARMAFVLQDCEPIEVGGALLDDNIDDVKLPATRS
ncbi:Cupin, RmlC-type [Niveomyces insectorum RCEF 264]|uniref:Cupin, RmlC-type n=1 Tax=Niveomyces insectorum RCEF 264 TaxID=1081102 RepID=A0A167P5A2_9HYPO|nr:Cupin, RmlC-type [Niveomyces insectorum RCEF 264]